MTEPERLSYSQLNSFTSCAEQYRLERVIRVPRVPAWYFAGGTTVHTMTELHDLRELGVDVPERTFEEVFEEETAKAEEESGVDRKDFRAGGRASVKWPDKENADWWLAEGPAMVRRWITWRRANTRWEVWITPGGVPAVELGFTLTIENGEAEVRGYVDRVFEDTDSGSLIVLDVKTGSRKQATPRQLGVYKQGIEDAFPGKAVRFGTFWDARSGNTSEVYPLNEYSLRRLEWQYGALRHARQTGLYLPNPSMCSSCGVRDFCYEVGGERAHEVRPPWVSIDEWEAGDVA